MIVLEERYCSTNWTNGLTSTVSNGFITKSETILAVIFLDDGDDPIQYTIREGFRELPKIIEDLRVNDNHYVKFINSSVPIWDLKVLNMRNTSIYFQPA
jgi:hypothetical protein